MQIFENLSFTPEALRTTLPMMLYGMLGGILVMAVICLIISLMYRMGKGKEKNAEE